MLADTYNTYAGDVHMAMVPHLGNTAYVNYAAIRQPQQAYFANAARITQVKQHDDPDGLFTQPQSV